MIYAKSGMKGHNVESWQNDANKVAAKVGFKKLVVDGVFGSKTLSATIAIQRYIGVKPDGIVGDGTRTAFSKKFPYLSTGFIPPNHPDKPLLDQQSRQRILETKLKTAKPLWYDKKKDVIKEVEAPKKSMFAPLLAIAAAGYGYFKLG